ncbi:hypothetical protein LEN26_010311 [Aphanomyces euteiches]|nr:hypothetical protein LEN26_010311 [Aphanomyces euteiches]
MQTTKKESSATTSTLAQTLWRKQRLLTQEVLQAMGKAHASDDSAFQAELAKFYAFLAHVRSVQAHVETQRSALQTFLRTARQLGQAIANDARELGAGLQSLDVHSIPSVENDSVDQVLAAAMSSIVAKVAQMERHEIAIRARAAAKLELDSLRRVKKATAQANAASDAFSRQTLDLLHVFKQYEACQETFLATELNMVGLALRAVFLTGVEATTCDTQEEILLDAPHDAVPASLEVIPLDAAMQKQQRQRRKTLPQLFSKYKFTRRSTKPLLSSCHDEDNDDNNVPEQLNNQDDDETIDLVATDGNVLFG